MCAHPYKEIYFKKLANVIAVAGEFEICRACCQAGNSVRSCVTALRQNSFSVFGERNFEEIPPKSSI